MGLIVTYTLSSSTFTKVGVQNPSVAYKSKINNIKRKKTGLTWSSCKFRRRWGLSGPSTPAWSTLCRCREAFVVDDQIPNQANLYSSLMHSILIPCNADSYFLTLSDTSILSYTGFPRYSQRCILFNIFSFYLPFQASLHCIVGYLDLFRFAVLPPAYQTSGLDHWGLVMRDVQVDLLQPLRWQLLGLRARVCDGEPSSNIKEKLIFWLQ